MVVPLILATVLILIFSPVARRKMFPPAPLALVSASHGGLKTPKAGLLGSKDSMTGAPEARKGEAVEQEAANFVSGVAAVAVGSAAGKGGPVPETTSADGDDMDEGVPDPMQAAAGARKANAVATGGPKVDEHDKTKAPVQNAMWKNLKVRKTPHARKLILTLTPVAALDACPRCGVGHLGNVWKVGFTLHSISLACVLTAHSSALSPVPPFNPLLPRLKLAAPLAPLLLVSLLTPPAYVWRGLTFALGAAFFSDPLMQRGLRKLNRRFPNWPTYLDLRLCVQHPSSKCGQPLTRSHSSLLKGVPTNAQLSVTLLRLAEAKKAPLPPPPTATEPPQDEPVTDLGSDTELDASDEEVRAHVEGKVQTDDTTKEETLGEGEGKPSKPQRASKLLKFVKGTTKGTVSSALGVDRAKAAAGSEPSKRRVGVVDPKDHERDGPSFFLCRHHGKKGHAILSNAATTPCLSFAKGSKEDSKGADPAFSIMIEDICELKKLGGLGWKVRRSRDCAQRATDAARAVQARRWLGIGLRDRRRDRDCRQEGRDSPPDGNLAPRRALQPPHRRRWQVLGGDVKEPDVPFF